MRDIKLSLCLAVLAPGLAAQGPLHMPASFAPAQSELPSFSDVPWMRTNARVQMFYDASEAGASQFTATGVSLRYDGPIPKVGAPGPFQIQRLIIKVGTSTVPWPGAAFDQNASGPLTTVFDGAVTYWPDQGSQTPAPWGGLNDALTFPFTQPVPIQMPAGGWFVVEMSVAGNDLAARAHAILDGASGPGGPQDGSAFSSGQGCPAAQGAAAATIATSGTHAPGAAHGIHGSGLGAGAPVFAMIGFNDQSSPVGPLPFPVPSTSCTVYTSWDLWLTTLADASGSIPAGSPATTVPVPPDVALGNLTIFEQLISLVPVANPPWGLVFSDKRTVQLGMLTPLGRGMYTVANGQSATAPFADWVQEFGYALRVQTQ